MAARITTRFGEAVPPATRHSVTTHMGGWDMVERFGSNPPSVIAQYKIAYPRMKRHPDVVELSGKVIELVGATASDCFLFTSLRSARQCVDYATSKRRDNGIDRQPLSPAEISVRAFRAHDLFFAVIFPSEKQPIVSGFWSYPGVGISSRFAEINLSHIETLREVSLAEDDLERSRFDSEAHQILRDRVSSLLARAAIAPPSEPTPTPDDVYLFPSGMAAICRSNSYLLDIYGGTTVLFGMAFTHTVMALDEFSPGFKFFSLGTDDYLAELEDFLEGERSKGSKVQAIWVEFPSNPVLVTADLVKLRELADEYNVTLGVDETIGSWANVDVSSVADLIVSSATKSFNGYADAIAGCAILNPRSAKYKELKPLFDKHYFSELYIEEAQVVERNSRDYLARTAKLNSNAQTLVDYLQSCADDPNSVVQHVHYPSLGENRDKYRPFMRRLTPDFTPGYGCLFNVELENLDATRVFYDTLNLHKSVHLGAPFTLALAYSMCIYKKNLDWAAKYGLRPTQIRVSAGLEDIEILLKEFRIALDAANEFKAGSKPKAAD